MSHTLHIDIEGMTCGHCTARVHAALEALPGVTHVEVVLDDHMALVSTDAAPDDTTRQAIIDAIEEVGFEVPGVRGAPLPPAHITPHEPSRTPHTQGLPQVILDVRGMTCASCVARVERALSDTDNVALAQVNYATERATITPVSWTEAGEDDFLSTLEKSVKSAGYDVASARIEQPHNADEPPRARHTSRATHPPEQEERITTRLADQASLWRRRFGFGLMMTPPIMLLQMGPMWFDVALSPEALVASLAVVAYLTLCVVVVTGRPFLEGAWKALRHGSANMDTLVALGALTAFTYSLIVTLIMATGASFHGHVYFDGAAMIVTLISLGKWLEVRARGAASASMESLLALAASNARVWIAEEWQELPVSQVQQGDKIAIKPGEKVPVDARVLMGTSDVNESMLTGESVPVSRGPGDEIMAATLNVDGYLEAEAIRVGGHTTLAHIIKEVERAQQSKADIQRLADRISSVFVPMILVLAVLTLVVWWAVMGVPFHEAISPAIAVLVVACPCALGLATPTALMVGSARGAKQGVLIREANALEQASRLDALIFDKTGTLTTGMMHVTDVIALDEGCSEAHILEIASALERGSEHPIAAAIRAHAGEVGCDDLDEKLSEFKVMAGHGVEATFDGTRHVLGKPSWVLDELYPSTERARIDALREEAKTVVVLANETHVIGAIAVMDTLRDQAREAVEALTRRDIKVWMVTGDDERVAHDVARRVGIPTEQVRSQVLPGGKAEIIRDLQQTHGLTVAMVGDGINDAPALVQANLGIAMGSGAQVAMEAADMTLVGHDIMQVVVATNLARATYRTIRQNLFWAFAYNAVLIPVAAAGLLVPALAAGAMALSSVSVVSNSLLLRARKIT